MENKKTKKRFKRAAALCLFLFLICWVFVHLTYLFRGADWSAYNIFAYRNEKKDSIDVVLVGGSSVYRFWNPLQAYYEQGFTSYDYTSSNFPAATAIAALNELQITQNPKLIILDIRTFHTRLWNVTHPGGFRLFIDSMEPSLRRIQAIHYYGNINKLSLNEMIPFYIDISYYHTNKVLSSKLNWSLLDHRISEQTMRDNGYFEHGFLPGTSHYFFETPYAPPRTTAKLKDNIKRCYVDLLEYAQKSDVPILLIESPFIPLENDVEEMNTLINLAEEYHVPILNANSYTEEMGLDFHTDFYDTNHVNILGAEKYTKFLGKYLSEHYDLPDHRNDSDYAEWDSDYQNYVKQAGQLKKQTQEVIMQKNETITKEKTIYETIDPLEWLAMTDDSNLTILFVKQGSVNIMSQEDLSGLKHLGLSSENFFSEGGYLGVYSGSLQYAEDSEMEYSGMVDMIWGTLDDISYSIFNEKIIVNSLDYPVNSHGITTVVIDNNTKETVDYAVLDADRNGRLVLEHILKKSP